MRADVTARALRGQERPIGPAIRPVGEKGIAMPLGVETGKVGDGLAERRLGDLPVHGDGLRAVVADHDMRPGAKGHVPVAIESAVRQQAQGQGLVGAAPPTNAKKSPSGDQTAGAGSSSQVMLTVNWRSSTLWASASAGKSSFTFNAVIAAGPVKSATIVSAPAAAWMAWSSVFASALGDGSWPHCPRI